MARRKAIFDSESPYHISSRCINKDWFELPLEKVWDIFSRQLYFIVHAYNIKIHAFVLMKNHFHLIATSPDGNMSEAMAFLLRETSREITKSSGRINRTWGGRFFRSRLGNYHYYTHAYKYIYRNPVDAGMCSYVEEYPFSTLCGLLGLRHLLIPVVEDTLLFDSGVEPTLKWLNSCPSVEAKESVRKALRKPEFSLKRDLSTAGINQLEHLGY